MKKVLLTGILLAMIPCSANAAAPFHLKSPETRCQDCHLQLPFNPDPRRLQYHEDIGHTCEKCHKAIHQNKGDSIQHPVSGKPSGQFPNDLPTTLSGNLSCITCHYYHVEDMPQRLINKKLLRRPMNLLFCQACHKDI